jgi:dephospho-CoA kinase
MLRLGLTGGIASGKSAVAAMLRDLGFPVLAADPLSHRLMEPGQPAYEEILQEFGTSIVVKPQHPIDRAKLAAVVFSDPAKLACLNAILHPRVEKSMLQQFDEWERAGIWHVAFVEAALLVEAGFEKNLNGLVLAWCSPTQQLERLLARGMSEIEARRRLAAQMSVEEKLKHATYKIDCSRTLADTQAQVQALAAKLHKPSPS